MGNVADRAFVENIFSKHRPELVFHAAAYQHVLWWHPTQFQVSITIFSAQKLWQKPPATVALLFDSSVAFSSSHCC
ncbi:polysaccharide biosynthesis protein [Oligoflexus sp.]|uniref:polysaccharide biosynthesis protein n=1 Tax=Oligoflexus sp. TaxID=1971216 RepID=UPI0039C90358